MFGLKLPELLIIVLILVLLFGATRLPQLGSSLGSSIRNFKRGFNGDDEAKADDKKLAGGGDVSNQSAKNQDSTKA